ncbi:MAG: aldehyde dehydrogenase (NADP(+)) [Ignavibacteriae bacterium]|nr:aldehyde dehydrogenase (NADP(+)) [Ignavibacteriota bacterium]
MKLTGKHIIGSTLTGEGTSTFRAFNPSAERELEPQFHEATPKEIDAAVQLAETAFQQYRTTSGKTKAAFLEAIADEIMALGDELLHRCSEETGLPEARLVNERGRTVNQLKLFASLVREGSWVDARIDPADPERKPLPKPDVRSMQRPLGPVAVFGSSNFPLAFSVAGGDTASALAAGCTVVAKAHPAHPGTCELIGRAIQQAVKKLGMPEGTFSMVQGKSNDVGLALVRHPLIKALGFTGSFRGGKALFDEANMRPTPIPVYAEMGSTNPVFILPRALKERNETIARDLSASVTLGVGQFCTNPGLVFLQHSADESQFTEALSKNLDEAPPGVMLTPAIQTNFGKGLELLKSIRDVSVLTTSRQDDSVHKGTPTLLQTNVQSFLNNQTLQEEVFGPSTLVVTGDGKQELFHAAEALHGHLTATIHGTPEDLAEYAGLIAILEQKVGRLIVNGYPTGVEVTHAMVHGGPYPATTDSRTTSVGTAAITRFTRPVCYQNFPAELLPEELRNHNPLGIWRLVNGERRKDSINT